MIVAASRPANCYVATSAIVSSPVRSNSTASFRITDDSITALALCDLGSSIGRSDTTSQIRALGGGGGGASGGGGGTVGGVSSRAYRLECSHHLSGTAESAWTQYMNNADYDQDGESVSECVVLFTQLFRVSRRRAAPQTVASSRSVACAFQLCFAIFRTCWRRQARFRPMRRVATSLRILRTR